MPTCEACGRAMSEGAGQVNLGSAGKHYHMGCAPAALVADALTEWNAIVAKGVKYFVEKYLPAETRPVAYASLSTDKDNPSGYSRLFTDAGEALRAESSKRQSGRSPE
jgi:hypothetical protein